MFALAAGALALGTGASHACSCIWPSVVDEARSADAVFVGTVSNGAATGVSNSVEMTVTGVYKGRVGQKAVVIGGPVEMCGIDLRSRREYVVFAERDGIAWLANGCGNTAAPSATRLAGVEQVLGPAAPPQTREAGRTVSDPDTTSSQDGATSLPWLAGGVLAAVVVTTAVAVRRRRRPQP